MSIRVLADVMPAEIPALELTGQVARLVITTDPDVVLLYVVGNNGAVLARTAPYTEFQRLNHKQFRVVLGTGEAWDVEKGPGCGCGSPLTRIPLSGDLHKIAREGVTDA